MNRVYVLNSGYECIGKCKLGRAFTLVRDGRAEVVKNTDLTVRSSPYKGVGSKMVSAKVSEHPVPMIIRVYQHVPLYRRRIKFSNRMVWERDDYTCRYCGVKITRKADLTTDHVKPKSRGGRTNYENMATACSSCNSRKADKGLENSGMFLRGPLPLAPPEISASMKKVNEEVKRILEKEWKAMQTTA